VNSTDIDFVNNDEDFDVLFRQIFQRRSWRNRVF